MIHVDYRCRVDSLELTKLRLGRAVEKSRYGSVYWAHSQLGRLSESLWLHQPVTSRSSCCRSDHLDCKVDCAASRLYREANAARYQRIWPAWPTRWYEAHWVVGQVHWQASQTQRQLRCRPSRDRRKCLGYPEDEGMHDAGRLLQGRLKELHGRRLAWDVTDRVD